MHVCTKKSWTSAPASGFSCGPGDGENFFGPWTSGREGQKCPQDIRTKTFEFMLVFHREVLNGVGADGVGVKFPIFPVNCSFLPFVLGKSAKKSEEKRKKRGDSRQKRGDSRAKKGRFPPKSEEKGEIPSSPIYTNPLKNLFISFLEKGVITSDTQLLLTRNYSKIIIIEKVRILYVIPRESPSFPKILRVLNRHKITNNNSQRIMFVIISCQRVRKGSFHWTNL